MKGATHKSLSLLKLLATRKDVLGTYKSASMSMITVIEYVNIKKSYLHKH